MVNLAQSRYADSPTVTSGRAAARAGRPRTSASVEAPGNARAKIALHAGPALDDSRLHLRGDLRGARVPDFAGHQVLAISAGHHGLAERTRLAGVVVLGLRLTGTAHDLACHMIAVVRHSCGSAAERQNELGTCTSCPGTGRCAAGRPRRPTARTRRSGPTCRYQNRQPGRTHPQPAPRGSPSSVTVNDATPENMRRFN